MLCKNLNAVSALSLVFESSDIDFDVCSGLQKEKIKVSMWEEVAGTKKQVWQRDVCSAPVRYKSTIAQLDATPTLPLIFKTPTKPAMCALVFKATYFSSQFVGSSGRLKTQ